MVIAIARPDVECAVTPRKNCNLLGKKIGYRRPQINPTEGPLAAGQNSILTSAPGAHNLSEPRRGPGADASSLTPKHGSLSHSALSSPEKPRSTLTQAEPPPPPRCRIGRDVEIHGHGIARGHIRHAVFDFDGTLSLIRAGWQEVMTDQFVGELEKTPTSETREELLAVCRDFITRLTGQQTIYQMLQLEAEIARRGGAPRPALEYKHEYLGLLQHRIADRVDALKSARERPAAHMVHGSTALLEGLRRRGTTCYLASGTDLDFVRDEAGLLGVTSYFSGGIYGALDDYKAYSKGMLIDRIVSDNRLRGPELVVLGDGYVEVEQAKRVGGLALGVASRESGHPGWDLWKKSRLLEAEADILVPDWQEADLLLAYLFDE